MKLIDIDHQLHESVNEAPVGMLKRAGTAMKAKFGMGATKAMAKGAQDTSTLANSLYKDLFIHAGKQGVKKPDLDFVVDYLQQVGFAPNTLAHVKQGIDPHFELNKKQIGDILLKAVQKRATNQQKLGKTAHQNLEPGQQPAGSPSRQPQAGSPSQQPQAQKSQRQASRDNLAGMHRAQRAVDGKGQ